MVKFLEFEKELHKQDSNSKGNLFEDYTKWYLENSPLYNFNRISTFFEPNNYTNVRGVAIFGY